MIYLASVMNIVFEKMQEYPVPRDHVVTAEFAQIIFPFQYLGGAGEEIAQPFPMRSEKAGDLRLR